MRPVAFSTGESAKDHNALPHIYVQLNQSRETLMSDLGLKYGEVQKGSDELIKTTGSECQTNGTYAQRAKQATKKRQLLVFSELPSIPSAGSRLSCFHTSLGCEPSRSHGFL
jgi:hypothetical protein